MLCPVCPVLLSSAIKYEIGTLDFPQVVNVPRLLVWRVPLWQCSRHQFHARPAQAWTCTRLTVGVGAKEATASWPPERRSFPSKVFPTWTWEIMIAVISTPWLLWLLATTPWRQEGSEAVSTGLWTIPKCTDHWDTSPPQRPALNITGRKWSQPRSGWIFPIDWLLILTCVFLSGTIEQQGMAWHWDIFIEQLLQTRTESQY